jgi:hypothetical protein
MVFLSGGRQALGAVTKSRRPASFGRRGMEAAPNGGIPAGRAENGRLFTIALGNPRDRFKMKFVVKAEREGAYARRVSQGISSEIWTRNATKQTSL